MSTEWLLIAGIVFLLICLVLTVAALVLYSGLLDSVEIGAGPPPIQEAVVAYKFARGPYKYSSDLFADVVKHAPNTKCMGIYYDDPKVVPAEKLRYAVGAVLSEGNIKVEKDVQNQMISEGYKIIKLPSVTNAVKTTFPYKNSISIFFAIMKVYPKMASYIAENRLCAYPFLELYEPEIIHFFAPLARQEEFFVEEANDPEMQQLYNADTDNTNQSFQDSSMDGSASFLDATPDTSCSRSMSTFSSRPFTDVSDTESETDTVTTGNIQDEQVTSSIELQREAHSLDEMKATSGLSDISSDALSLQDSGVCSGRASTDPQNENEASCAVETSIDHASDSNASTSSFEEIHMDDSINGIQIGEAQTSVRKE